MRGAIPQLPQYVFMVWCSIKAQGFLYLYQTGQQAFRRHWPSLRFGCASCTFRHLFRVSFRLGPACLDVDGSVGCERTSIPYDLDKGGTWTYYKSSWVETGFWITVKEDGRNSCSGRASSLKTKTLGEGNPVSVITRIAASSHADWNIFQNVNLVIFIFPFVFRIKNYIHYHNMT
jgi:hypothetical protein